MRSMTWLTRKKEAVSEARCCLLGWEVSYAEGNPTTWAGQVQSRNEGGQRKLEKCLILIPREKPPDLENGEF